MAFRVLRSAVGSLFCVGDALQLREVLGMTQHQDAQPTDLEKKREQRRLAAELTAEFDIPFVIWEDFEQALAKADVKARKT